MKGAQEIHLLVGKADGLPTLPGVAVKLLEAVQKEEPNLAEIGRILSNDAALTAKMLKLVNSSFYGLPTRVTTVDHAIKLLGLNAVKNLALSFCLITGFQKKWIRPLHYSQFWKDSLLGAIAANLLAGRIGLPSAEDAFFLGLLQDIGSLALACCLPEQYGVVISETGRLTAKVHPAENQHLGLNHMEVGEYLIRSWGLPESFYIPIGHHHCPEALSTQSRDCRERTRLLHLSSLYIDVFNSTDLNIQMSTIEHFIKEYGLSDKFDPAGLAAEIHRQAQEVFPIFDVKFTDDRDYASLLATAKAEMARLSVEMIAELLEKNKEIEFLREQTTIDSMTCIHNYKGFCECLSRELSRAKRYRKPLSLIFADIDHFKEVNDTFGHQAGDHALKAVAVGLKKGLRDSDYLARYGGEEFAVILPEANMESAFLVAERLRERIRSQKMAYRDQTITLTMSFGVASMAPNQDLSSDSFIKMADDALYIAKTQGRDRCCAFDRCGNGCG
ncbi:MAG: HDOD domain-containing protein [Hyphomicrobiales bacterium]